MGTQTLLSLEQFLALPDREEIVRELDEGQLIEMSPPNLPHAMVVANVLFCLKSYIKGTGAGFVVGSGAGFAVASDSLRIPDAFVIRRGVGVSREAIPGGALQGAPELAVQVVSPGNSASDLDRKVNQYLSTGAVSVWVIYPATRHVMFYRRNGEMKYLSEEQVLTEAELLPQLEIPVKDLFEDTESAG